MKDTHSSAHQQQLSFFLMCCYIVTPKKDRNWKIVLKKIVINDSSIFSGVTVVCSIALKFDGEKEHGNSEKNRL